MCATRHVPTCSVSPDKAGLVASVSTLWQLLWHCCTHKPQRQTAMHGQMRLGRGAHFVPPYRRPGATRSTHSSPCQSTRGRRWSANNGSTSTACGSLKPSGMANCGAGVCMNSCTHLLHRQREYQNETFVKEPRKLSKKILVPFPVESPLSGVLTPRLVHWQDSLLLQASRSIMPVWRTSCISACLRYPRNGMDSASCCALVL